MREYWVSDSLKRLDITFIWRSFYSYECFKYITFKLLFINYLLDMGIGGISAEIGGVSAVIGGISAEVVEKRLKNG